MESRNKIVLTADQCLVSNYRNNSFAGYLTALPYRLAPSKIFDFFFPRPSKESPHLLSPPLGLRTIESILLQSSGTPPSVQLINPEILEKYVRKDTLLFLSTMDPLGLGPATSSWQFLKKAFPYHVYTFWRLIERVKKIKQQTGCMVVVGGAGAWQLNHLSILEKAGIDYLFLGEVEKSLPIHLPDLLTKQRPETPKIVQGEIASEVDFHPLYGPTLLNMVEITRGCGRMCQFCSPTRSGKLRSVPKEILLQTARNFVHHGQHTLNLQSEDTLRWASKDFHINSDAYFDLYRAFYKTGIREIHMAHATFSDFAAHPEFIQKLSKMQHKKGQKYLGVQPGIESGSDRLMRKLMPGKYLPLRSEHWHDIVLDGFKVMTENGWVPTCSMILGLPGEEYEDLVQTEILIRKLIQKNYFFIFAPLLFVPVPNTPLGKEHRMLHRKMTPYHQKLYKMMWKYNLRHFSKIWNVYSLTNYQFPKWKQFFFDRTTSLVRKIL